MLSNEQEKTLRHRVEEILVDFLPQEDPELIDLLVESTVSGVRFAWRLIENSECKADDASCGPTAIAAKTQTGTEVRCPHCHNKL